MPFGHSLNITFTGSRVRFFTTSTHMQGPGTLGYAASSNRHSQRGYEWPEVRTESAIQVCVRVSVRERHLHCLQ